VPGLVQGDKKLELLDVHGAACAIGMR